MSPEPQRCPNGHAKADPAARFCTLCGLPFAPAAAPAPPQGVPVPPAALAPGPHPDAPSCATHPDIAAIGTCPRCGTFTCAECLRRGPDGAELCLTCLGRQASQLPWDHRGQLGTLRAFWRTSILVLKRPTETFATAVPGAGIGSSLWFAIVAQPFAFATTMGLYLLFVGAGVALAATSQKGSSDLEPAAFIAVLAVVLVVGAIFALIWSVVGLLLNAALDHLVLKMIGANPKSFEVTLRGCALSKATAITGLIPFCGPDVYLIWMFVARVFAYRGLHRISTGQAAAGALIVPGVFFTLGAMGYFLIIALALVAPS